MQDLLCLKIARRWNSELHRNNFKVIHTLLYIDIYIYIYTFFFEAKHIYPYIHGKSLLFLKYMDDIFMICNGTTEELILSIYDLNKKHKTIKFDYKMSTEKIEFLNPMVYKDWQNRIQTKIFRKSTDQQTYLHAQSNHPKSPKDSIPYSQPLRKKTICSTTSEFNKNCEIITKRFKGRGYPENSVNEQVGKMNNIKRK